jgi:hypothetical protein
MDGSSSALASFAFLAGGWSLGDAVVFCFRGRPLGFAGGGTAGFDFGLKYAVVIIPPFFLLNNTWFLFDMATAFWKQT